MPARSHCQVTTSKAVVGVVNHQRLSPPQREAVHRPAASLRPIRLRYDEDGHRSRVSSAPLAVRGDQRHLVDGVSVRSLSGSRSQARSANRSVIGSPGPAEAGGRIGGGVGEMEVIHVLTLRSQKIWPRASSSSAVKTFIWPGTLTKQQHVRSASCTRARLVVVVLLHRRVSS